MSYSKMEIKFAETTAITLKEVKRLNGIVEMNLAKGLIDEDLEEKASLKSLLNTLALLDYDLFKKCFPVTGSAVLEDVRISDELEKIIRYGESEDLLQYSDTSYYDLV